MRKPSPGSPLCLLLWSACGFAPSGAVGADGGGGTEVDGSIVVDGSIGAADAAETPDAACADLLPFAPSNFNTCQLAPLNPPLVLEIVGVAGVYDIDTVTGRMSLPGGGQIDLGFVILPQPGAPDLFVIAAESFRQDPNTLLNLRGPNAVAIVSIGDLTVEGFIDAGIRNGNSGPGGNHGPSCSMGRGANGVLQTAEAPFAAGGGGGGGAFGAAGGTGAAVSDADKPREANGGDASDDEDLVPLRGGCAGGQGGGMDGGAQGVAGGALQLVAGGALLLATTGTVTARGGGGGAVMGPFGGGGGGGSGGGLLLEGGTIQIDGNLTANGGSGAEGAREESASDSGRDGIADQDSAQSGGNGTTQGGDGGNGGARDERDGQPGETGQTAGNGALAGGGGGGGSVGRIRLNVASGDPVIGPTAVVSPEPQ